MASVRLVATVQIEVDVPDGMTAAEQQSEARRASFEMLSQAKSGRRKRKGTAAIMPVVVGVNVEPQTSGSVGLDWASVNTGAITTSAGLTPVSHTVTVAKSTVADVTESR